jgi:hypothetical protein
VPAHYAGCEPGVLDIFSKYSLKLPRICSNILDISLSGGRGGLLGKAGRRSRQVDRRTDNPIFSIYNWFSICFNFKLKRILEVD